MKEIYPTGRSRARDSHQEVGEWEFRPGAAEPSSYDTLFLAELETLGGLEGLRGSEESGNQPMQG